jgi:hypothetical protein
MSFLAHHIASWLGIPAGVVIAGMLMLRKKGTARMAHREQSQTGAANTSNRSGSARR